MHIEDLLFFWDHFCGQQAPGPVGGHMAEIVQVASHFSWSGEMFFVTLKAEAPAFGTAHAPTPSKIFVQL
jgi:hypothetical protein